MRRLRRILPSLVAVAGLIVTTLMTVAAARAQAATPKTVPEMWDAWCSRCHGKDGKGKVDQPTITVEPMDFTDCRITTPEGDSDWEAVIAKGGPAVGLSSQMPAFGDFVSPQQVTEFVAFIKKFCGETGWPSGNLNLPRPMFAEKAFPEDELIFVPMVSHKKDEPVGVSFAAVYERRIGRRGQIEMVLPMESASTSGVRSSGVGDFEFGVKYALNPMASNHLFSAGFDVHTPTGNEDKSLGEGQWVFEPYLATATVIGSQSYLQTQLKLEFPKDNSWDDRVAVYNIYFGRDARLLPSTFTFGVELNGENDEVALTPQIRKGLSKTGALAGAFGVRLPLNHRSEQGVTWVGYLLWEYLEPVRSRR
ncbi:MAG TPA: c-type cytochrome [Vicinamibacterales bacterium]|nr:c-type cytochrome [Vicinamibacterales bacterium]